MSENTYYGDYLGLEKLLSCQHPRSVSVGRPAHDEMLFIITHQTYELWFRQILHELHSVLGILQQKIVPDTQMGQAVSRLERICEIQQVMIQQIQILETMRPLDFLDFRDLLIPASGFQSFQFRLIEIMLGLPGQQRIKYHEHAYYDSLSEEHKQIILDAEKMPSLFNAVEAWLERTPFLRFDNFDFWQTYHEAVEAMFAQDRERIEHNPLLSAKDLAFRQRQLNNTMAAFELLFDTERYESLRSSGERRLSHRATQAALLIMLYRERPILHMPYRLLNTLVQIDELLTTWRYRHALMVQRMIGAKQGTGGSMGYNYLIKTLDAHRIFGDFTQLTTFLIPRSALPELPARIDQRLGFAYGSTP